MQEKIDKKLFVFEIIASQLVALNGLYWSDHASHQLSMCWQTVLGFCVLVKETFSNATTLTLINKYCKDAAIQIATVFRYICRVVSLKVLWNTGF